MGLLERFDTDFESSEWHQRGTRWRAIVTRIAPKGTSAGKGTQKEAPALATPKKEEKKHVEKEQVYKIRAIALRLVPIGGALDVEELRVALRGQGIEWDDATVAEAISVLV